MHTAFQLLHNKETDMVLGKAEDGGYYLIGLHKSAQKYLGTINVLKLQHISHPTFLWILIRQSF